MKKHEARRAIWHEALHCDIEQLFTDDDGNDLWAVVACYNLPTSTGDEKMTAPNYGGWTDARAGMRWQETLAKSIAHELKEQMDDFLNAAGEAIDQPLEALHRELNSSSLTLSDAVALVYAQHELKPEGEQDAAGIAEIDEWLGESPSLHDIAIKSAEYNVRRAHETGMNIEWAENRLREERIKATRRAAA